MQASQSVGRTSLYPYRNVLALVNVTMLIAVAVPTGVVYAAGGVAMLNDLDGAGASVVVVVLTNLFAVWGVGSMYRPRLTPAQGHRPDLPGTGYRKTCWAWHHPQTAVTS